MADRVVADAGQLAAKIQEQIKWVEQQIATTKVVDKQSQELVIQLEAMKENLTEHALRPMRGGSMASLDQVTKSLEEQNQLRSAGTRLDVQQLDTIKAQTQARIEQAAVLRDIQTTQRSLIVPPTSGRGGSYESLAGQQVAAAERAQIRTRLLAPAAPAAAQPLVMPTERRAYAQTPGVRADADLASQRAAARLAEEEAAALREVAAQSRYIDQLARAEAAGRSKLLAIETEQLAVERERATVAARIASPGHQQQAAYAAMRGYDVGQTAAQTGQRVAAKDLSALSSAPKGVPIWTAADRELVKYNVALGQYEGYAGRAGLSTGALTTNLTRVGIAESQASTAMRRHGALTTEYLSALARGETTIQEFGYQVGATIAKFAGWTAAAGATYAALGAVFELGKGAIDASSGVQQLHRTIENLDTKRATDALMNLSRDTNVPIKEASEAMFQFSRTFHNVGDAAAAAHLGLAAFKLDQVAIIDSVKLQTELQTQYNASLGEQRNVYDMLSAGQRQYNARMQQTIPALGISLGSVKNTGGDLSQLVQQIMYIQSTIPTQGGTRIGTAIYRSASNFLNPATPQGKKSRADLEALGIDTQGQGWTQILDQAIRKAPSMSRQDRSRMAQDIFYRQFGGRVGESIFGNEAVTRYLGITGQPGGRPGDKPITPATAAGSLQGELSTQLKTARETMRSFINEIQRLGAAVGESGVIQGFTGAIRLLVDGMRGIGTVVGAFAGLPSEARKVVVSLLAVGATLALLNRTRWGSSLADATGLSKIPGIGASETRQTAFQLRTGTSAAQKAVQAQLEGTQSQILANEAEQNVLKRQQTALVAAGGSQGSLTRAQLQRSNALLAEIDDLKAQEVTLQLRANAQLQTLQELNVQQNALRSGAYSKAEIAAMGAAVRPPTAPEGTAAASGVVLPAAATRGGSMSAAAANAETAAMTEQAAVEAKKTAESYSLLTIASANLARSRAIEDIAIREQITFAEVTEAQIAYEIGSTKYLASQTTTTAAAMNLAATEAVIGGGSLKGMATGLGRFGAGIGAFVSGLSPMLIGMLALPLVLNDISNINEQIAKGTEEAARAAKHSLVSAGDMAQAGHEYQNAANEMMKPHVSHGLTGAFQGAAKGIGSLIGLAARGTSPLFSALGLGNASEGFNALGGGIEDWATGRDPLAAAQAAGKAQVLGGIGNFWQHSTKTFGSDTEDLAGTPNAKALYGVSQKMRGSMLRILMSSGLGPDEVQQIWTAYTAKLQSQYMQGVQGALKRSRSAPSEIDLLGQMDNKTLEKTTQAYGDRAQAFGLSGGDLRKAGTAYLLMAGRMRDDTNQADLQGLSTAQQSYLTALNKNVTRLLNSAKSAPSFKAESGSLDAAAAQVDGARKQIADQAKKLEAKFHAFPGFLKAVENAANQLYAQLDELRQSILQQKLAEIKSAGDLRTSQIGGSSPEADMVRAASDLQTIRDELTKAKSGGGSPETIAGLQQSLNDGQRNLAKQRADQARALIQAQGQIASASITGTGPEADIARARQEVATAQSILNHDISAHAGRLAIAQDYAALKQAQTTLLNTAQSSAQAIHQDAAALLQAQGELAQARTTDPVKQARIQLSTDLAVLKTIKPADYKSYKQYQTAITQQQAKILNDRTGITSAYVNDRMSELQFEQHINQITDQQYINGLQNLLKTAHLSAAQRRQLRTALYDAMNDSSMTASLGTDSIKMPTTYEVRRAIVGAGRQAAAHALGSALSIHRGGQGAQQGASGGASIIDNHRTNVTMTINLHRDADMKRFAKVLDDALRSNFTGSAQAMGLI